MPATFDHWRVTGTWNIVSRGGVPPWIHVLWPGMKWAAGDMVAGLCKIIEQCVSSHWRFTHVQLVSACVKEGATGLFECNAVRAVCCTDSTVVAYWSD